MAGLSVYDANGARRSDTRYNRTSTGRIHTVRTEYSEGRYDYTYDYAGRLLTATNIGGQPAYNQTFTNDRAGRMRSNSHVGQYYYAWYGPQHAPYRIGLDNFTYDANGNMTTGLAGKVMTYNGENRPLSVSHNGVVTSYVYGADGTRLMKTEGSDVTVTFGSVEIRHYGQGSAEEILTYPVAGIRLVNGVSSSLHSDQLGS
ncbi:MAG TPA: hypothetical protein DD729_07600, partial [Rhodobacteraceae bacterium]|nr:hypothetical protein [Paracoccaceae bacterium]